MATEKRCPICGKALTGRQKSFCPDCKGKGAIFRYYQRKAAGLCTRCGVKPPEPGRVMCAECLAIEKDRGRNRYAHTFHGDHAEPKKISKYKKLHTAGGDLYYAADLPKICPSCRRTLPSDYDGIYCPACKPDMMAQYLLNKRRT